MRQHSQRIACVLSLGACLTAPSSAIGQGGKVPQEEINAAIARGIDYLRQEQQGDGSWPYRSGHNLGMTALAGLAILENGEPADADSITNAASYIRSQVPQANQTYDAALAILFLARLGDGQGQTDQAAIQVLASQLDEAETGGMWSYIVPQANALRAGRQDRERISTSKPPKRSNNRQNPLASPFGRGDNSNTQFALLGLWAAGRLGFHSSPSLEAIDEHFRSSIDPSGRWGYTPGDFRRNSMTCAGLMGLVVAAARPELAERKSAKARGTALSSDKVFQRALRAVSEDARQISGSSDIYYLWSLERVCVALDIRLLDGFDWYNAGARELLRRQLGDGGWPQEQWGRLPSSAFALLFLRKANLAFELDRVLRMPGSSEPKAAEPALLRPGIATPSPVPPPVEAPTELALVPPKVADPLVFPRPPDDSTETAKSPSSLADRPAPEGSRGGGPEVIVTGANDSKFPEIAVDFELRDPRNDFVLDATRDDFKIFEEGKEVEIVRFLSPYGDPQPITVALVVDRSGSMEEDDRIGGLKAAVGSFLKGLPKGSKVAVVAFGSEVEQIIPFTDDFAKVQAAVDQLTPAGATRYYDAVANALELIQQVQGRRAVLALTDGEDTFSQEASLKTVTASARRLGLPVHTLGLGSEDEIESDALRTLATETRGQYYPAREADQLRTVYQQLAKRLRSSYTAVYRSDRKIPDGTLRPVRVVYRSSSKGGETAVFIPGMVVPAPGWSRLFLGLIAGLGLLFASGKSLGLRRS